MSFDFIYNYYAARIIGHDTSNRKLKDYKGCERRTFSKNTNLDHFWLKIIIGWARHRSFECLNGVS